MLGQPTGEQLIEDMIHQNREGHADPCDIGDIVCDLVKVLCPDQPSTNWLDPDVKAMRLMGDIDAYRELTDQQLIGQSR